MTTRVRPLECGWLTSDLGSMLSGYSGQFRTPVPAFLVEHAQGLVLFDTGLHPDLAKSSDRLGPLAGMFTPELTDDAVVSARLDQLGVDPRDISMIVGSHLHFDHCGGNALVPNARFVVQRSEWEAAHDPAMVEVGVYTPDDYEVGHDVQLLDGEHDLFGDGAVRLVTTIGHTAGHQSMIVEDRLVLVGDACYCQLALDTETLPPFAYDGERQRIAYAWLRAQAAAGKSLVYSHDPDQWASLPDVL